MPTISNLNYSAEFKLQVVNAYLAGGKTYQSVAAEYEIFAPTTVRQWVMTYNDLYEELMDSRPGEDHLTWLKIQHENNIKRNVYLDCGALYCEQWKNWLTDVAS
ncbi:MAG: transposase [Enterocloster bolteae]